MSTIDINNTQSNTDIINACLLRKNKKITELNINKECSGIVDLLAIPTDYNKIKAIYFMAGNITQIINIPANITMISASNNKINTIDQFPESIEHIILDNNLFKDTINLSNYIYLKHLNLANNRLVHVIDLPKMIQYLNVEHNLIQELFLTNIVLLSTLYCEYNPNLIIYNSPDTIVNSNYPPNIIFKTTIRSNDTNTDNTNLDYDDISRQDLTEYKNKLSEYFELRNKYMDKLQKNKQKTNNKNILPNCINCNKPGMLFSGLNNKYTASCGNEIPCNWKLIIHRGKYHYFRDILSEAINALEDVKEKIIKQKMDTLFGYISESTSAELFDKQVAFYKSSTEILNRYMDLYINYYSNPHKNEIIQQKQQKIQQLLVTINDELGNNNFDEAVLLQVNEILPLKKYIQKLTYEYMAIPIIDNKMYLHQDQVTLDKHEINIGQRPSFNTK